MGRSGGRVMLQGGGVSWPVGRVARPGLAVDRGTSPGAECLDADEASADQVLESAIEGAAAGPSPSAAQTSARVKMARRCGFARRVRVSCL